MRSIRRSSDDVAAGRPSSSRRCRGTAPSRRRPRPSLVMARCTWPIDAAAIGSGSHRRTARSGGAPSSASMTPAASSGLIGGTLSCSRLSVRRDRRGEALVDVAGHLAELDHDALHGAERGGHVVGGLHGEVVAQLLAVLPGGDEQARRAAGVPQATADSELGRGQAALEPQPADPAAPDERQRRRAVAAAGPGARSASAGAASAGPSCAGTAARIRRTMRCLASRTPGSPRKTASSTPSACRISSRRDARQVRRRVAVQLAAPSPAARSASPP